MARPLIPFVRGGSYYPSRSWTPLVRENGFTTQDGGEEQGVPKTVSGSLLHIIDALAAPVSALSVAINPVQSGNGDPAPDNVRPISGWTQAKVTRTGKSLLQLTGRTVAESPGYDPSSIRDFSKPYIYLGFTLSGYCNPAKINSYTIAENSLTVNCNQSAYGVGLNVSAKPSTAYVFSFKDETQGEAGVVFFGADVKRISAVYFNQPQNWAFTTPADCENMMLVFYPSTTNADKTYELPQLEIGSTATAYEPYAGTTIPISWQSEAGTIYGGTLDVLTGVLTVDKVAVTIDGDTLKADDIYSFSPNTRTKTNYPTGLTGKYNSTSTFCLSDKLKPNYSQVIGKPASATELCVYPHSSGIMVTFPASTGVTTKALADAWFAENTPMVCYELATPLTYQLTSAQLATLAGENNVWADTGDTTMTYMAEA